jgi:hypothetical protein
MRQYRGLTKEGKWVYGWYVPLNGKHHIFPDLPRYDDSIIDSLIEVIPKTVGQFSPKYNKWEGDIVEVPTQRVSKGLNWYQEVSQYDGSYIARCVIIDTGGEFALNWDNNFNNTILECKGNERDYRAFQQYPISEKHKTIGNRHQNPSLLEKQ